MQRVKGNPQKPASQLLPILCYEGNRVWVTGMVKEREYVTRVSLETATL